MPCSTSRTIVAAAAWLACAVHASPTLTSHEYQNLNNALHLDDVNVMPAWNAGATGSGVTVAVIDSGIDLGHPDLAANIAGGRNFVSGGSVQDDFTGHGTQVSGLIAADYNDAGVVGIAYDAKILPLKAFHGFSGGGIEILNAIDFAASQRDVRVINMSFGGTSSNPAELAALQRAALHNKVLVISAGNAGGAQPDFPAGLVNQLLGAGIAVGALGADDRIASFSNRAGAAKDYFLLAPGYDVWSTTPGGSFEPVFGSSFSASYVSGAAALLADAFPNLGASQIVEILLVSADDIGAPGPDAINGRGRLNIGRAFAPIGATSVPSGHTPGDGGTPFSVPALRAAPTIAAALRENTALLEDAIILDRFERAFSVDLSQAVRPRARQRGFEALFDAHYSNLHDARLPLSGGRTLTVGYLNNGQTGLDEDFFVPGPGDTADELASDDLVLALSGGTGLAGRVLDYRLALNESAARQPGSVALRQQIGAQFLNRAALTSPYLGYSDRQHAAAGQWSGPGGWRLHFGMSHQDENETHGLRSSAAFAETSLNIHRDTTVRFRLSQLWERGSLFGGASAGSFSVAQADTTAFGVSVEQRIGNRWRLLASADVGYTRVDEAAASLLTDFSLLRSDAWGLGLLGENLIRRADRAGFALMRPLRVQRGATTVSLPVAMDVEARISRASARLDLEPGAQEIDLEAFYQFPLNDRVSVSSNLLWRLHPDHMARRDSEVTLMGALRMQF